MAERRRKPASPVGLLIVALVCWGFWLHRFTAAAKSVRIECTGEAELISCRVEEDRPLEPATTHVYSLASGTTVKVRKSGGDAPLSSLYAKEPGGGEEIKLVGMVSDLPRESVAALDRFLSSPSAEVFILDLGGRDSVDARVVQGLGLVPAGLTLWALWAIVGRLREGR